MSGSKQILSILVLSGGLAACDADPVGQQSPAQRGLAPPGAVFAVLNAHDEHGGRHVAMVDDCDASDPNWDRTGGCALRGGVVNEAEFNALLISPLAMSAVGHPAWRMQPSYLRAGDGKNVTVTNIGGRTHTFTPVANYGGGRVPPLNAGLTPAPECAAVSPDPWQILAGEQLQLHNLSPGNHRFQCCIHPWMRALIKVQ